jgi:uncharacterized membrane protein
MGRVVNRRKIHQPNDEGDDDARNAEASAVGGVVAALVFVVLAVGCGLVSDQGRQEAKKKVEAKGQQVPMGASKAFYGASHN